MRSDFKSLKPHACRVDGFAGSRAAEEIHRLPADIRTKCERLYGYNLADVRVHIGSRPSALGCAALACGPDIYVCPDDYAPGTTWGHDLLCHELAHVAQQAAGRVRNPLGCGAALVVDPALEAEADRLALQARTAGGSARPLRSLADCPRDVIQPIVIMEGGMASGTYKKGDLNLLWANLSNSYYFTQQRLNANMTKKVKTKLEHWVNAPKRTMLWGKGHEMKFGSLEELARALIGRVTDRDSKALERQLATRIKGSRFIRRRIADFINFSLALVHARLLLRPEFADDLNGAGVDAGRYAYFYSSAISGLKKSSQRSLSQAMQYMQNGQRPITEMSAFLCDYALVARDAYDEDAHPYILPEADGRSTHFNVNEQSAWVKRARSAHVRLGAGPSATTMNVMRMGRGILGEGQDHDITLLCIALGLFAFWNLEMGTLQMFSEVHTYHEVMLVAHGYGVATVPALNGESRVTAEFEYPQITDIPA